LKEFFMRFHLSTSPGLVVLSLAVAIGCGGGTSAQLVIPDSPDGTVRVVLDGLVQHHPEIVWRALPPSYQQDVADLTRDFADSVDAAVFDRAVAVARKGVVVLQSKKDLILESETFMKSQVDPESVDAVWENSVHMLDIVLASELTDLAALRSLEVEAFLSTTGSALMDHVTEMPADNEEMESFSQRVAAFKQTEVELVSEETDHALVLLTVPGEEPTELQLVRVEGRWIPVELASQWPQAVAEADARIELLSSDEAAQLRVQVLFGIGVVEGFIDQIDQMETSDEIDDLLGGFLGNIMPRQGGPMVTEG
jgi:hypothetical protein